MSVLEYKCPCCGAPLVFSSTEQNMHCESCDNNFAVETLQQFAEAEQDTAKQDSYDWKDYGAENQGWAQEEQMRVYVCPSCGGEIMTDANTAATTCPYCDNHTILQDRLADNLRPDLIIPFKIPKETAQGELKDFCKGKKLLPKGFAKQNRIDSITGIYVPFWLFGCDTHADMQFRAQNIRHWTSGDYEYTRTDYYLLLRSGDMTFEKVPVDGSIKMPDDYMEALEPYHYSMAVDFNTAYLSGYLADKYDADAEQCKPRANERIKNSVRSVFNSTAIGYSVVTPGHSNIQVKNGDIAYALLPVWVLNTVYKGKTYTFAMNGQTGKFVGELPVCRKRYWAWVGGITGILGFVAGLISTFL